jgi:hypothetical protein
MHYLSIVIIMSLADLSYVNSDSVISFNSGLSYETIDDCVNDPKGTEVINSIHATLVSKGLTVKVYGACVAQED